MPPYRDICARARNPRGLLPFRSLKVCRNLFPRCGGRCFGFRRRRRLCRKDFRAVRRLPGAECVKDGGERLVDLGADLFVADDGDGVGHCDAMQGAYAEILADVVKSLEERLGQDGQGRDARAVASDSGRSLEMPLRVGSVSYALMNSVSGKARDSSECR